MNKIKPRWATRAQRNKMQVQQQLISSARQRVGSDFHIIGHGEIGEYSNGALILKLADALEASKAPALHTNS